MIIVISIISGPVKYDELKITIIHWTLKKSRLLLSIGLWWLTKKMIFSAIHWISMKILGIFVNFTASRDTSPSQFGSASKDGSATSAIPLSLAGRIAADGWMGWSAMTWQHNEEKTTGIYFQHMLLMVGRWVFGKFLLDRNEGTTWNYPKNGMSDLPRWLPDGMEKHDNVYQNARKKTKYHGNVILGGSSHLVSGL